MLIHACLGVCMDRVGVRVLQICINYSIGRFLSPFLYIARVAVLGIYLSPIILYSVSLFFMFLTVIRVNSLLSKTFRPSIMSINYFRNKYK